MLIAMGSGVDGLVTLTSTGTALGPNVGDETKHLLRPINSCVASRASLFRRPRVQSLPQTSTTTRASGASTRNALAQDVNPWTSASEVRSRVTADALLWGAGDAAVIREGKGNPAELHRLLPWAVITTIDLVTQEASCQYNVGSQSTFGYTYRDVIALMPVIRRDMTGSVGPLPGLAPIASGRDAIGLAAEPRRSRWPSHAFRRAS